MQWRGPVLLIAGLTMIYLVSLLQEVPFPHPVIVQATEPSHTLRNEATHIILNEKDDQMHRTKIWFDATLKGNLGKQLGVGSLRMNVNGKSFKKINKKERGELHKVRVSVIKTTYTRLYRAFEKTQDWSTRRYTRSTR
jgi:hypothetical protein